MPSTYETYLLGQYGYLGNNALQLISSTTLGAPAASVSFTSIPQTPYSNLVICAQVKSASTATNFTTDQLNVQFNGVSTTSYNRTQMFSNSGGTPSAGIASAASSINIASVWNSFPGNTSGAGNMFAVIPEYSGTTFFKSMLALMYASDGGSVTSLCFTGGTLGSTTAGVSQLTFTLNSGSNFLASSYIALYGC